MKIKKKLTAVFAILLMIVSFFAVAQFPVQAQLPHPIMVSPGDLVYTDVATGAPLAMGSGTPLPPMNVQLTNKYNGTLMGNLLIVGIFAIPANTSIGAPVPFNLSSYNVGFMYNPAVLKPISIYNVTPSGLLPPTVFQGTGKPASMTPGSVIHYFGKVTSYNVTLTTPGDYVTVNSPTPLLYVIFLIQYYGSSLIDFTWDPTGALDVGTALADQNGVITIGLAQDGNFKFQIHQVTISPGMSSYFGDDCSGEPYGPGDVITLTVSIKNTEPIHSWAINISYDPSIISVPSNAFVGEGSYFKMLQINNTFTVTPASPAGWIHVNCTALPGANRTGDGLLMYIAAALVNYGVSPLVITHFRAVDNSGSTIPNLELAHSLTDPTIGVQFEKIPIIAMIDNSTGYPLMGQPGTPGPGMWTYPAHNISETFTAAVYLLNTTQKVNSWKAGFTFNPRVLQVVSINDANYLPNSTWIPGTFNNTSGIVSSYSSVAAAGNYSTGPGALMYVTFHVIDYGVSEMGLTDSQVAWQTQLKDLNGKEIKTPSGLVFATDQYTEFEFRATVTAEAGGKDWYATIGETFSVNVTLNTMENITGWNVGFTFDPDVLNCTNVAHGNFLLSLSGSTTTRTYGSVDNINGIVTSHGEFYDDAVNNWTKGTGVLLTLTFEVVGYGKTNINISATTTVVVTDRDGEECVVTIVDGEVFARIPGDVSGDCKVGSADIILVGNALFSLPGDPNYNPFADVNGDGKIGSADIIVIGNHLFEQC